MTDIEAAEALEFSNSRVLRHTDYVLRVCKDGAAGLASSILLEVDGRYIGLSCHHILRPDAAYFIGPMRLERDSIVEGATHSTVAARIIASDAELDLVAFEIPGDAPAARSKEAYRLTDSAWINHERVSSQLFTAAFICALYGEASRAHQYPDGLVYTQLPIYSALGPIISCDETLIVADFAEKSLLYRNDTAFPQLKGMEPTGGPRDLHGISGSGLWIRSQERMYLAGIVLGRACGTVDQHLLRSTPVWAVTAWLRSVLT